MASPPPIISTQTTTTNIHANFILTNCSRKLGNIAFPHCLLSLGEPPSIELYHFHPVVNQRNAHVYERHVFYSNFNLPVEKIPLPRLQLWRFVRTPPRVRGKQKRTSAARQCKSPAADRRLETGIYVNIKHSIIILCFILSTIVSYFHV